MALAETVTLGIGAAIAKNILRRWLQQSSLAADVGASIVDVLKTLTSDKIALRRGEREFEAIGERVAESLLPIFAAENPSISDNGRKAVALAVAETLESAKVDAKLLVSKQLDPAALTSHFLSIKPEASRDFSSAEKALYERIVSESSQRIVDIASRLPSFSENTFAELLRRENQLLDITNEILVEVKRIRDSSDAINPEAKSAQFEIDYRLAIGRTLDEIQLFGIDLTQASRRHRLSVVYVTLMMQQPTKPIDGDEPERLTSPGEVDETDDLIQADEVLVGSSRLMLRGWAGSGKTTFLQWVAVNSATRSFQGDLKKLNDCIPFFIRLRHFHAGNFPPPEQFAHLVAQAISGRMPSGWVHQHLADGRAILLIDGVDEIPSVMRDAFRGWLLDLVRSYPKCNYIVTSRPNAIQADWLLAEGFKDAELQPMELPHINSFIDHWHMAVKAELQRDEEKAEVDRLGAGLKETIRLNNGLRVLATNPLLCAVLCALHRDRHEQLPRDRIELYDACSQMLLERRDLERRIEYADYPRLTYRQKRAVLQDFAYWMLKNGWTEVPKDKAEERFERTLATMPGRDLSVSGSSVGKLLVERSGIIREPVPGHIDFAHRTFEEFLAAQAAVDEGDVGVLLDKAHDDQWREVVILAVGLANRPSREKMIKALLERGDREPSHRHQLHLLAVACLETAIELPHELVEELQRRLQRLIPPSSISEAKILASAGELAVPYLARKSQHGARTKAACVRALALIGGESSLATLEGYKAENAAAVLTELIRAKDSFDELAYYSRVLGPALSRTRSLRLQRGAILPLLAPHLNHLQSLVLERIAPLSTLADMPGITGLASLIIHNASGLKDLNGIEAIAGLRHLEIWHGPELHDVRSLAHLPNLKTLTLWFVAADDLTFLAKLTQLVRVTIVTSATVTELPAFGSILISSAHLGGFDHVVSLEPMRTLTGMNYLHLQDFAATTLKGLEAMEQLRSLNIVDFKNLQDVSAIAGLKQLLSLNLHCQRLEDISPLAQLTDLSRLDLTGSSVRDLSPLIPLRRLQFLTIPKEVSVPSELSVQHKTVV